MHFNCNRTARQARIAASGGSIEYTGADGTVKTVTAGKAVTLSSVKKAAPTKK
jgi:hypothetical protein